MNNGMLSIIIVSYNSWPEVGECLRSLRLYPPDMQHEVILIDNASSDGTVEQVLKNFHAVNVIASSTNDGYGVAVNRAVRSANGTQHLLLNPDTTVTAGAIDTLVAFAARHPAVGIVGPRLLQSGDQPQPSGRRFPSALRTLLEVSRLHLLLPRNHRASTLLGGYWDQDSTRRVDWVSGACHYLPEGVLERIGPLTEETFCGFDDFEYCWRAAELGLETWLCAESIVHHGVGVSVGRRWTTVEVDALAINNMYVILNSLWPRSRTKALAFSELCVAASDYLTALGTGAENRRRIAARVRLLFNLLMGRMEPVRRCDPADLGT